MTLIREAVDDIKRFTRDKELNSQLYKILTLEGIKMVPSSSLKVGDVIIIEKVFKIPYYFTRAFELTSNHLLCLNEE